MRKFLATVVLALVASTSAFAETIKVAAGGDLQAALNRAQAGDVVALQPGATFTGTFTLPPKTGTVTLTSDSVLPERTVNPTDAPLMATLGSPYGQYTLGAHDAKNWKIDGIQFLPNVGGYGEIIAIERGENITLDRILIIVPTDQQQKRAVTGNGKNITLTRSYISGVWRYGQDSQAFCAWNGSGPYTITYNYLEAAGENIMFGGADSSTPENVPADILVEGNHITKPLSWKGTPHGVKNLFELKAAKRAIIRNNLFENNWADAQAGRAIVFTPRNQDNKAPWSVLEDILFENNIVRNTPHGIMISGRDDIYPSAQSTGIVIRNNTITTTGIAMYAMQENGTVAIYNNTINVPTGVPVFSISSEGNIAIPGGKRASQFAVDSLVWAGNITPNGYIHSPTGLGEAALKDHTNTYSLVVPVVQPPPPVDPVVDLKAKVAALETELAALKTLVVDTTNKLAALLLYLAGVPK